MTGFGEQSSVSLGYCCSQVPVEIILAAGFKPLRLPLFETDVPARTTSRTGGPCCMRLRRLEQSAQSGEGPVVYGLVLTNGCDAMLRFYSLWGSRLPVPCMPFFNHLLQIPFRGRGEAAVRFYHRELVYLKESLESHFAIQISDANLRQAVREANCVRQGLRDRRARLREACSRKGTSSSRQEPNRILVVGPEGPEMTRLLETLKKSRTDIFFDPLGCIEYPSLDCLAETPGETPLEWIARHYVDRCGYCPRAAHEAPKAASLARWMGSDVPPSGILLVTDPGCRLWRAEAMTWQEWAASQRIPLLWINGNPQGVRVRRTVAWLETFQERYK